MPDVPSAFKPGGRLPCASMANASNHSVSKGMSATVASCALPGTPSGLVSSSSSSQPAVSPIGVCSCERIGSVSDLVSEQRDRSR